MGKIVLFIPPTAGLASGVSERSYRDTHTHTKGGGCSSRWADGPCCWTPLQPFWEKSLYGGERTASGLRRRNLTTYWSVAAMLHNPYLWVGGEKKKHPEAHLHVEAQSAPTAQGRNRYGRKTGEAWWKTSFFLRVTVIRIKHCRSSFNARPLFLWKIMSSYTRLVWFLLDTEILFNM